MAEIRIEHLTKNFDDFVAVKESSFTVEDGEFFVMLGPSGCGKTTTLRMIAGLEMPSSGKIWLDNEDVTYNRASQRDIAFVFQMFALYPHMNVRKNIGFPLLCEGVARSEIKRRVEETAQLLRIDHLLNSSVSGLAGGDRQRVALGRSIIRRPKAFMMDEPLGALDTEFRDLMVHELRGLHDRIGATTVYVTHDQMEAMAMADKIVVMNNAVVEQFATPQEIYDHPKTMFVANFIGSPAMNFLKFKGGVEKGASNIKLNGAAILVPKLLEETASDDLALGVRPEHIQFDDASKFRGEVIGTEYLGTTQIITLETSHGQVKARITSEQNITVGEIMGLSFLSERLSLFDVQSGRALHLANREVPHG